MRGSWDEMFATDPWDPESQQATARPRPLATALSAPIGWVFNSAVAVLLCLILMATAPPGGAVMPFLAFTVLLGGCGLSWLIRLCMGAGRPEDIVGRSSRGVVVAPILVVVAATLVWFDVPTRAGFELSRGHFQQRADEAIAEGGGGHLVPLSGERVGLFRVDGIRFSGGAVLFETGSFFLSTSGFAYSPDAPPFPDHPYAHDVTALGDGWYAYTLTWD